MWILDSFPATSQVHILDILARLYTYYNIYLDIG
jgi:hypothetical protein